MALRLMALVYLLALAAPLANAEGIQRKRSAFSCLDDNGKPVDWWIILKLDNGFRYVYRDSKMGGPQFVGPNEGLDDETANHALSRTMNAFYQKVTNPDFGYLIYNDQPASTPKAADEFAEDAKAHAKGLVGFDSRQGIWLIHSVPQFPNALSSGVYSGLPPNSRAFGQSFLCVTYPITEFSEIGAQLYIDNPLVVQGAIPIDAIPIVGDQFSRLVSRKVKPIDVGLPQSSVGVLTSKAGKTITSFAKSARWKLDLYEDLIAPYFKTDLLVRTWMRAPGNLPTFCAPESCANTFVQDEEGISILSQPVCHHLCNETNTSCQFPYSVMIVNGLKLSDDTLLSRKNDHSKWAISAPNSKLPIVCIGDINTQTTQRLRGGGSSCIEDEDNWLAFQKLIDDRDHCDASP
jgi:deoxyribonuclease-2